MLHEQPRLHLMCLVYVGIFFALSATLVSFILPDPREVFINIRHDIANARNRRIRGSLGQMMQAEARV